MHCKFVITFFGHSSGAGTLAPLGRGLRVALVKIRTPDELNNTGEYDPELSEVRKPQLMQHKCHYIYF